MNSKNIKQKDRSEMGGLFYAGFLLFKSFL
jgi:hypothetical protein